MGPSQDEFPQPAESKEHEGRRSVVYIASGHCTQEYSGSAGREQGPDFDYTARMASPLHTALRAPLSRLRAPAATG